MKIGIDGRAAKWYRGTGIGTYTYQLIKALNAVDIINKYLLFMPQNCACDIPLNKNFQLRNITENIQNNFWDEINIPNILEDKDIELYHVPQNGIGLPRDKKCPFIITLHDVIPFKMPETVSEKYLKIFSEEVPRLISLCDAIITVSEYSKEDIIKTFNYPRDKIYVTYLASEDIYHVIDTDESITFINNNYSINSPYILYVGGFSPRKNIIGLIEAFSKLISYYKSDIKLVIAGNKGISYNLYKKRAIDLNIEDKVIFPGFIPMEHLPYLYNAAKLFVYPSYYEGFGLPPIEAMACGVPVIASNVTSIPEILEDSAILINPYDIDELCSSMYNALEDTNLRATLICKGLVKASNLSWLDTGRKTLNAYGDILSKNL